MKGFIFDIDGVIVDSERLHFDVLCRRLPQETNGVCAEELIGLSLEDTLIKLGIHDHHAVLSEHLTQDYEQQLTTQYLRLGVHDFIRKLVASNIPFGFVSTAPKRVCEANLSLLGDLLESYALVSGDCVDKTKPHPEPYLKMLSHLGLTPGLTTVIEDTDIGISSARAAGVGTLYAWPHALSSQQTYDHACHVLPLAAPLSIPL